MQPGFFISYMFESLYNNTQFHILYYVNSLKLNLDLHHESFVYQFIEYSCEITGSMHLLYIISPFRSEEIWNFRELYRRF